MAVGGREWLACCLAATTVIPQAQLRTVLGLAGVQEALHRLGAVAAAAGRADPRRGGDLLAHCLAATTVVSLTDLISHACSSHTRVHKAVDWLAAIGTCPWRAVYGS
jgi:hypothetical protein